MPLGRPGDIPELADQAAFLVSDGAGYITGEVVTIDGGEWLGNAGQFNLMKSMSDADWVAFRERQKGG